MLYGSTMGRLEGKAAFITGAGGAIGSAIARRFVREGAAVMCVDIDGEAVGRVASSIKDDGARALALACDVSDASEVKDAIDAATRAFSRLDVLVNAAAVREPLGTVVELDQAEWERALAVNLTGVFLVCKHGIPSLIAAGGGSIVIIASQLGHVVVPRRPAYVTSKAALIQLARSLALDHAKDRIRVNTLSPGAIETGRLVVRYGDMEAARKALVPLHPIGRLGQPDEIANGALFLANDESLFMTGADLVMDGGYTCV
jgi:NAD(P)-dependent dehydrogenase (short-subunit alcohol dehydrogenase family)